jgi:hypothetical protein
LLLLQVMLLIGISDVCVLLLSAPVCVISAADTANTCLLL